MFKGFSPWKPPILGVPKKIQRIVPFEVKMSAEVNFEMVPQTLMLRWTPNLFLVKCVLEKTLDSRCFTKLKFR